MDKLKLWLFIIVLVILAFFNFTSTTKAQTTLFEDNFDSTQNGTIPSKWQIYDSNPPWQVQSGRYGIFLNPGLSNTIPKDSEWNYTWQNISYDLDMFPQQGTDKNVLIKFKDGSNFIEFHANDKGVFLDKASTTGGAETITKNDLLLTNNKKYHFHIEIISNSHIKVYINNVLTLEGDEPVPLINNWKIGLRAGTGGDPIVENWFDNVVVTDDPSYTTYIPPSVTKVVLVPGLGASWNPNAFSNCKFDGSPENWSMAPYAQSVYQPIIDSFTPLTNLTLIPFYYDWRREVTSNSSALSNYINSLGLASNEQINIIGHSMGGLVAAKYASDSVASKINTLLAVGAPFGGAVQAYPAWAGGDIWEDNFITKVAMNLYLKHCGGLFSNNKTNVQTYVPSVNNLLPIFPYLQDVKTLAFKPIESMHEENKNKLLPISLNIPSLKLGSLYGTGFSTLSSIPVRDNKNWLDGKPAGKVYLSDGDGTVLSSSAQLPEAEKISLPQSHSGLIASTEGICKIFVFLSLPCPVTASTYLEPKSALVVIGYPANFMLIDQNGNSHKDSNGMVSFINPISGSYKLSLLPKSNSTLLIVAQFLPNGQVKYKEYNLQGLGPKFKTLNFSLENPQEDILN